MSRLERRLYVGWFIVWIGVTLALDLRINAFGGADEPIADWFNIEYALFGLPPAEAKADFEKATTAPSAEAP